MLKPALATLAILLFCLNACSGDDDGGDGCSGAATSCSAISSSSCSDQSGCSYAIGTNVSSTSDDTCRGSATACSDIFSEERCSKQKGCHWK